MNITNERFSLSFDEAKIIPNEWTHKKIATMDVLRLLFVKMTIVLEGFWTNCHGRNLLYICNILVHK